MFSTLARIEERCALRNGRLARAAISAEPRSYLIGLIIKLPYHRQRIVGRVLASRRNTERARKCHLRNEVVVLGGDQLWNLVLECALGLENVKLRDGSRLIAAFLVFQLALEKVHRLFLNLHQSLIEQDLIELGTNGRTTVSIVSRSV